MASTLNADNGVSSGTSGVKITSDASGVLAIQSSGTTTATFNASGYLGIGTASPSRLLEVSGATGISRVTSTTGTNAVYQEFNNTGGVN